MSKNLGVSGGAIFYEIIRTVVIIFKGVVIISELGLAGFRSIRGHSGWL